MQCVNLGTQLSTHVLLPGANRMTAMEVTELSSGEVSTVNYFKLHLPMPALLYLSTQCPLYSEITSTFCQQHLMQ